MFFMQESLEQLDIDYIFQKIKVQTPYGEKQKKDMRVYKAGDESALYAHYDTLDLLKVAMEKHPVTFKKIREVLNHFKTLDLTLERIYGLETLSVTELFEVKYFTLTLKSLVALTGSIEALSGYKLEPLHFVERLLDPDGMGMNTFYIYDAYSDKLRDIRQKLKGLEKDILEARKAQRQHLSDHLQLKIRPNDEVVVEKHKRDTVELLDTHESFVYVSDTVMHRTYRIKTDDRTLMKSQEVSDLKMQEDAEELVIRQYLTEELSKHLYDIRIQLFSIGRLDLHMAKAYFAMAYKMVRPQLTDESVFQLEEGIHLKVQEHLKSENLTYMPISVNLSAGVSCITGANMGGKTICLRLIGQMLVMAQYGLFVPCKHLRFKPLDFVFLSSQDAQSIDKGLSTFGAEMVNVSEVLKMANQGGLILIDELARGTNPKEGFAISKAIINHLKTQPSITVITTHFDGLADEKDVLHLQVTGLSDVDFEDLEINVHKNNLEQVHQLMDYRLKVIDTKEAVPKDAIKISKLMGVDEKILEDARRILEHKEE